MKATYKCILCGIWAVGRGNNPEPLAASDGGRCCDECNATKVIPARISHQRHPSRGTT